MFQKAVMTVAYWLRDGEQHIKQHWIRWDQALKVLDFSMSLKVDAEESVDFTVWRTYSVTFFLNREMPFFLLFLLMHRAGILTKIRGSSCPGLGSLSFASSFLGCWSKWGGNIPGQVNFKGDFTSKLKKDFESPTPQLTGLRWKKFNPIIIFRVKRQFSQQNYFF